jgi:hypothetical protein
MKELWMGRRGMLKAVLAFCVVSGMLLLAAPALANAPFPIPGTTQVVKEVSNSNGSITLTVEGQWEWPTSSSGLSGQETENDCPADKDGVGYQVAWFDSADGGYPIGQNNSPDGVILVGTATDDIVHSVSPGVDTLFSFAQNPLLPGVPSSYTGPYPTKTDADNWVSNCGTTGPTAIQGTTPGSAGTWGPISHTYPANFAGPIKFCPVMYDPHGTPVDKGGFGSGTGDITAGGNGHNDDSSYEGNGQFNACATITVPTFSTQASTGTPVGQPITDTATLSGASASQGGTISWNVYDNATCSGSRSIRARSSTR